MASDESVLSGINLSDVDPCRRLYAFALPKQDEGRLASQTDNVWCTHRIILFDLASTPLLEKARLSSSLTCGSVNVQPEELRVQA